MKKLVLFLLFSLLAVFLVLGSKNYYCVDYGGQKNLYKQARNRYRAGQKVTIYYRMIATDTDYLFYLDGELISYTYDEKKGFVIQFIMPDHDVKFECQSVNSMVNNSSY